jgi:hypothetical protein
LRTRAGLSDRSDDFAKVDRGITELIHRHIIEALLPYFLGLPVDVIDVLNKMLMSLPPDTTSIPFLAAPFEFGKMLKNFPVISKNMSKFQQVEQMCPELLSVNPTFFKMLLEQILILLKCVYDQFNADIIPIIVEGLARARCFEDDPDNESLIWRCLSLVPGVCGLYRPDMEVSDPTHFGDLVDQLVRLFLRVLHRPTSIDQYDRAVTALRDLSRLNIAVPGIGEIEAASVSSDPCN